MLYTFAIDSESEVGVSEEWNTSWSRDGGHELKYPTIFPVKKETSQQQNHQQYPYD